MHHISRGLARVGALLLFAALIAAAVLYTAGVYDFSFAPRAHGDPSATTAAPITTKTSGGAVENNDLPDEYALQFIDALRAATNISHVGAGVMTGGAPVSFDFERLCDLVPEGYELSYADFDSDGSMRLCLLTPDIPFPAYDDYEVVERVFYSTQKDNFSVPQGADDTRLAIAHGVQLYMGYILTDDGNEMAIYTLDGKELLRELSCYLYPALCRDREGHPLFLLADNDYWYFDENGTLTKSDYNDLTDSRGLYFDYTPDYGVADNDIAVYYVYTTVTSEITRLVTTAEPEETDEPTPVTVYTEEPVTAPDETSETPSEGGETPSESGETPAETGSETTDENVDGSSTAEPSTTAEPAESDVPTGGDEGGDVPVETTAEASETPSESSETPGETGEVPAETTGLPIGELAVRYEQLAEDGEGETEDPYADWELDPYAPYDPDNPYDDPTAHWIRPETTEPAVTDAPETTEPAVTDVPATDLPENTTSPDETTEIPPESTTDPAISSDEPLETTTEPAETEPPAPVYEVIDVKEWDEYRFGYGWSPWYLLTRYKYSRSFNFREGYAVSVWYDDVLSVVTEWGDEDWRFTRQGYFYNENGRLAYSIYTEPLTRGVEAIGSYYFDRGYLRVRQLDTDAYYGNPDWLVGQKDLLLDKNATPFPVPDGYTLIGYADGVLLLERAGKFGYYSVEGEWIAQPIYTYARPFAEGLGVIGFARGAKGVIDTKGNVVLPFVYSDISQVSSGAIAAYAPATGWQLFGKVRKGE